MMKKYSLAEAGRYGINPTQMLSTPPAVEAQPCKPLVRVAAGILVREDQAILVAKRPLGKAMSGYWEFPGGKLERAETPQRALERELYEELAIHVEEPMPWVVLEAEGSCVKLQLHFYRIWRWRGSLRGCEDQQLHWQLPGELTVSPMLPTNAVILKWLSLPKWLLINPENGLEGAINGLEQQRDPSLALQMGALQKVGPDTVGVQVPRFERFSERTNSRWLGLCSRHLLTASQIALGQYDYLYLIGWNVEQLKTAYPEGAPLPIFLNSACQQQRSIVAQQWGYPDARYR